MRKKPHWIKIGYSYARGVYDTGNDFTIIHIDDVKFMTVQHAIKKFFNSWTGKGTAKLVWFTTGPTSENHLSTSQKNRLIGKTYNFNN